MGQEIGYLRSELKKCGKETIELPYSMAKSQTVVTQSPPVAYVVGMRSATTTECYVKTEHNNAATATESVVQKNSSNSDAVYGVS